MQENINTPQPQKENEIDLGIFFNLVARIFRKIGWLISAFFVAIYNAVIYILLFIKRRLGWLLLGLLLGLSVGLYIQYSKGPVYYSDMVVRSNFESTRLLYNQVKYFNSLISQGRTKDLASSFHISEKEAGSLKGFSIEAVDDDLEAAKLYRNTFLDYSRNSINGVDTQWTRTMKFVDFKKQLNEYDFPLQEIRLYSGSADVFSKVQPGLIQSVSNNKVLQQIKANTTKLYTDEETMLRRSLSGLDSLRQAYNRRILEISTAREQGNNVLVSDKDFRNPEIDLYDKELTLKDELMKSKRKAIEQADILEVYSDFNPTGTKVSGYRQPFVKFALAGLALALGIILLYELFRFLNRIEKKRSGKLVPPVV